ncbi:M12 family metallo-peptidase [Flavobacterium terrisoli]|uniref:M12 family metallo-peptidase n=1 Tax=Flavobacterium terrisoli TaxID=3242195 RepID=UPI0025429A14|nr:M12 family metallo-peptidase [Flavobacterium buctense]
MKKILPFAVFLIALSITAQNKIAERVSELQNLNADFKAISVLSPTPNAVNSEVEKVVEGATLATINLAKVNEIVSSQYNTFELEIPYQNQTISILLYKVNPFMEGFHVDTDVAKNIAYQKGVYYRGIIKGETNSVSSFNFFNGEFNGMISSNELGNIVVGKLIKPNNTTDYIVYSDAKMKVFSGFDCHVKEEAYIPHSPSENNKNINSVETNRCVGFYFEVDNNLYLENGEDTTATTNWMTSVFNNVQTLYNLDGITTGLKSIFIWTNADPYEGVGTASIAYLTTFRDLTPVFDGDVGQLVGIDEGGLGGVAYLNTLCQTNNHSYSDVDLNFATVPTFSWTVQVITHEFGHSLGSPHTHQCAWNGNNTVIDGCGQQAGFGDNSCPQGPIPATNVKGTIMSYCHLIANVGISFNNGFGPQPSALIVANVNSKTCLSLDCITYCINSVTDITTTNLTNNSTTITWTDTSGTTSWQISVTPFATATPVWNTVTTNSYSVSGLNANTYYRIKIRPVCTTNIEPVIREKIFATNAVNFCSNTSFTDTGGTSGNYTNNESWTRTIIPAGNGLKIRASFGAFNLEDGYDFLYIHNGPTVDDPDLTFGAGLTGSIPPGQYNSTATDGSLTFRFYSDEFEVASGWNATITCTGTLGEVEADFIDFSYYPNPTNGNLTITSKDPISEVTVYNVQGQLLLNQKMNEMTTNVNMSTYASGTYFFKLKINGVEANFKVLKM